MHCLVCKACVLVLVPGSVNSNSQCNIVIVIINNSILSIVIISILMSVRNPIRDVPELPG